MLSNKINEEKMFFFMQLLFTYKITKRIDCCLENLHYQTEAVVMEFSVVIFDNTPTDSSLVVITLCGFLVISSR